MGSGTWSADTYNRVTRSKIDAGRSFSYTRDAFNSGVLKPHDTLDPIQDGKPSFRESRDSDEHPESTPIVIGFDVTGSMGDNPALIQESLKQLFGMLIRKDIVSDPQIAIGAYGDAYCDRVPLQIGQFESDNRIDDELDNVLIEGCGGGNDGETSSLLARFVGSNIRTDAWEKRGKKGYFFLIGDEKTFGCKGEQLRQFMGLPQASDESEDDIFARVREQWDVYMLLIDNYSSKAQHSKEQYTKLTGGEQHVITIADGSLAAATIVSVIGAVEATADYQHIADDLIDAGFSKDVAMASRKATVDLFQDGDHDTVEASNDYGDLDLS
jgi:hypothetical protein